MLKGTDFTLDVTKLDKDFQLVEISEWTDFNTKEKLGFSYTVILPKMKFEKLKVNVKADYPIVTGEELEVEGQITIKFENLKTWASVFNGRLNAKAEADNVSRFDKIATPKS